MRTVRQLLTLAALIAATTSCGNVARDSRSSAYLIIDLLQGAAGNHPTLFGGSVSSDVLVLVTSPAPCSAASPCPTIFSDLGSVKLRLAMKDSLVAPTTNNEVTITGYHVEFVRADGRKQPGVDVPYAFDGGLSGTIPATGQITLTFELVRLAAKEESPLVQLINSPTIITTIANVTFYGTDRVGNAVSVVGSITVDFGNFGDG